MSLLMRYRVFMNTSVKENAIVIASKDVEWNINKTSKIIFNNGISKIGGNHPLKIKMPSYSSTVIVMDENAVLEFEGPVCIAQGTYIHLRKNSKMVFKGNNYIGHNSVIICNSSIEIGLNSSTSWGVTLMDNDGHNLYNMNGSTYDRKINPLIIGDNVGIQMNVTIPKGITIGNNSLIGAGTILRNDVASNNLAFSLSNLKIKHGISAGLQFESIIKEDDNE